MFIGPKPVNPKSCSVWTTVEGRHWQDVVPRVSSSP